MARRRGTRSETERGRGGGREEERKRERVAIKGNRRNGAERRAINDALEDVTSCNTSAAMRRHIYYLDDTSIRPLIIILITLARKLPGMCASSHDSVINKRDFGGPPNPFKLQPHVRVDKAVYTRRA